jgi:hypothetical protein
MADETEEIKLEYRLFDIYSKQDSGSRMTLSRDEALSYNDALAHQNSSSRWIHPAVAIEEYQIADRTLEISTAIAELKDDNEEVPDHIFAIRVYSHLTAQALEKAEKVARRSAFTDEEFREIVRHLHLLIKQFGRFGDEAFFGTSDCEAIQQAKEFIEKKNYFHFNDSDLV